MPTIRHKVNGRTAVVGEESVERQLASGLWELATEAKPVRKTTRKAPAKKAEPKPEPEPVDTPEE